MVATICSRSSNEAMSSAIVDASPDVVINAGAFTHYAWAIHDALAAFDGPVIELHLSDPATREPWRHLSVVAPVAAASIAGLGGPGYPAAVVAAIEHLEP